MAEQIAEQVMGAKFIEGMPMKPPDDCKLYWSRFNQGGDPFCVMGEVCDNIWDDGKPVISWQPYNPESDLREAFEVVERMRERGIEVRISPYGSNEWCVEVHTEDPSDNYERTFQDYGYGPIAKAICEAALKAVPYFKPAAAARAAQSGGSECEK